MYLIFVPILLYILYTQRNYLNLFITRLIGYIIIYKNKLKITNNTFKILYVNYNNKKYDSNIEFHLYNDKPPCNIELVYNYNSNRYIIVYKNYEEYLKTKFPMYTAYELQDERYFTKNSESIILISTKIGEKKEFISDENSLIIKSLSGPKGDFYKDKININNQTIIDIFNNLSDIKPVDNLELFYSDGEVLNI